jgi:hypothetical protein
VQTVALAFTDIGKELLKVGKWSADHRIQLLYSGPIHGVGLHYERIFTTMGIELPIPVSVSL